MRNLLPIAIPFMLVSQAVAQNVGIGTSTPQDRLDVAGPVRAAALRITSNGSIDLGFGTAGKEVNAGRMGYGLFTPNTVDIVGAGTGTDNRRIRFWAEDVTEFTGKAHFFGNIGVGAAPSTGIAATLSSNSSIQASLRHPNALAADVRAGISFGGNNYSTGLIQTIGTSANQARMGFFTGYSFTGGPQMLLERLSITNEGRVGINRTAPTAQLEIGSGNADNWLRVVVDNEDVFRVSAAGLLYNRTKSSYRGAAIVNSTLTGLGKWGFPVVGAEMVLLPGSNQDIPHGVSTRINLQTIAFEQNNVIAFDDENQNIAFTTLDHFVARKDAIALVEFEVNWARLGGGFNPNEVRNGAVIIRVNETEVRRFASNEFNQRGRCYIKVSANSTVAVDVYHEHCIDPPGVCITPMARLLDSARITVIFL